MKLSKQILLIILLIAGLVTFFLLEQTFSILRDIFPVVLLILLFLNTSHKIIGITEKPRKKAVLLYGGFATLVGGGVLVASLSLNSVFFLPPCLFGIFMILFSLTIKTHKPQVIIDI